MIAFFVFNYQHALMASHHLSSVTKEVDGPFRLFKGQLAGADARIFLVDSNAHGAYAAGRLAARRGAGVFLPIGRAMQHTRNPDEVEPGRLLRVGEVWSLDSLAPLLRLLPDSGKEMPMPLDQYLPAKAVFGAGEEFPACGTFPWLTRNVYLMSALRKRLGVSLFDGMLAGVAQAAAEEEVSFHPTAFVEEVLSRAGNVDMNQLQRERRFETALESLFQDEAFLRQAEH